jgi:hypothetical protein
MEKRKLSLFEDKTETARTFLFLSCLIGLILLVYIVGALVLTQNNYATKSATSDSDAFFMGCTLLEKDCLTDACPYTASCGDTDNAVCRIYDCGQEYGIYSKDIQGKIYTKRETKPDTAAIETEREDCSGSMQVVEQNCVNGAYVAKVQLSPKGECKVGNFIVVYTDEGIQKTQVTDLGNNAYSVEIDHCGTVAELTPVTVSGMYLRF